MKIDEQKVVLEEALSKIVDNDYVYLDVPGYFNIGDQLIYNGAMRVLNSLPHKCRYQSIVENVREKHISDSFVIVLQGGGNWGDGYYTRFRNKIISSFPNNKIIIMPQTIRYFDSSNIEEDSRLYASHADLHLCARDQRSYDILKKHFSANHIYLLPDSAVGLWGSLPRWTKDSQNRSLLLKRMDNEASLTKWEVDDVDVRDWDSILEELSFHRLLYFYRGIRKVRHMTGSELLKDWANHYFISVIEPYLMKHIPNYFLKYDKLYTTRLHGLILAKLLDMPVEYQDTRYGKISGYCETWF